MPFLKGAIDSNIVHPIKKVQTTVAKRVEAFGSQYLAFGLFGILNYPSFYLIWLFYNGKSYESLFLRLTATLLCLLLLLKNYWPRRLKAWLPFFWYFTLLFCLPFFFFFMLFKNEGENVWLMSSNTILFWLILMVDWESYVVLLFGGFSLACLAYIWTTPHFVFNFHLWWGIAIQFIASFVVVSFFAHKKRVFDKKKLQAMSSMGGMIAHELRTPLAGIKLAVENWKDYFPFLLAGYKVYAKEHEDTTLRKDMLATMERSLDSVEGAVRYADNTIHTILAGFHYTISGTRDALQLFDLNETVQTALARFPFNEEQRKWVRFKIPLNCEVLGSPDVIIHVLHNLIKNALHVIKEVQKGTITIWTEQKSEGTYLYFEDTAKGISKENLTYIFEPFYTTKKETAASIGLGLYFCRLALQKIGASISCESVEGDYTRFVILLLPVRKAL